jgi:superfamily II DNA or RNA helicase
MMFRLPKSRKWQSEAFKKWKKVRKGIAKVVTGGGKTVFAGLCIEDFMTTSSQGRVVVIVPTKALRDQWYATITSNWGFDSNLVCINKNNFNSNHWKISILVINTARVLIEDLIGKTEILLIVDECHTSATEENRKALIGDWGATLGLSATPERQYDDFFRTILVPALGEIIIDYDYARASKDGVIAKFKLSNHRVELNETEEEEYLKLNKKIAIESNVLKKAKMFTSNKLERLLMQRASISKNAEYRLPVAAELIRIAMPKKTILFHESIHHIEALAIVLTDQGIDCRTYHSKMSDVRKIESLSLFVSGDIEVLLTCRALDEGFDLPDIEVGIVASMTKSPRQRIQRLGRILRKLDGKVAEIKTIHTFHEQEMLEKEAVDLHDALEIKWFG